MTARLTSLLGSRTDVDEFQVGHMLVWVRYDANTDRTEQISAAEKLLVSLEGDIPSVEQLVTSTVKSSVPAEVIGIRIEPDRTSSYDCTFFGGEYENELFFVDRDKHGVLSFNRD